MTHGHLHDCTLAYRFTFERKCKGNEGLSIFLCIDLECETYCLHGYHVKPKALYERGVADLANFGFENGQSSSAFDQCAQYPNPRLYKLINIASWAEKRVYLRRSLPSESRSSPRANVSCFACARSRALATTKFATGCRESFLRLHSKYVVQSMSKTGSGQRETRVSRRWEDVGSRRSVTR